MMFDLQTQSFCELIATSSKAREMFIELTVPETECIYTREQENKLQRLVKLYQEFLGERMYDTQNFCEFIATNKGARRMLIELSKHIPETEIQGSTELINKYLEHVRDS